MSFVTRHGWRWPLLFSAIGLGCLVVLALASTSWAGHRLNNNAHWDRQSHAVAHMDVVDRTGSAWPVYDSIIDWDRADNINAGYTPEGGSCGHHCVGTDANFDDPLFAGGCFTYGYATVFTGQYVDGGNHFKEGVKIRFNKRCSNGNADDLTRRQRQAVACQEEGHTLGLDHTGDLSSCMHQDSRDNNDETPNQHDYFMINNTIYDH